MTTDTDNPSAEAVVAKALADPAGFDAADLIGYLADHGYRIVPEGEVLWSGITEGMAGATAPDELQPQSHSRITLPVPPGTPVVVLRYGGDGT